MYSDEAKLAISNDFTKLLCYTICVIINDC